MNEECTIILPLPSAYLHPNRTHGSRNGRFRKARLSKSYRAQAREATKQMMIDTGPWDKVDVTLTFYHSVRRNRDDINFASAMKPAFDGIVEAGLVVDDSHDHWTTQPVRFEIDREAPRVEIRVEKRA